MQVATEEMNLDVAKQRNGACDTIKTRLHARHYTFDNLDWKELLSMKFRITFKDPDGFWDSVEDAVSKSLAGTLFLVKGGGGYL